MKKNIKNIVLSLSLFAFIFAGCATTSNVQKKAPAWVEYPTEVYPSESYMTYVGSGRDRKQAEVSALNGLSAIFEQSITSDTVSSSRMEMAKKGGVVASSSNRTFDEVILKKVDVDNLIGVEIKDYWVDENTYNYFAIAVLDKAKAISLYTNMIQKNGEVIRDITNGIGSDIYSLQAYSAYDFAQEINNENKKNLQRLYVIDHHIAETLKDYVRSEGDFIEKKREIANKIPISIEIEGDKEGFCEAAFLDAFKVYNFSGSKRDVSRYILKGKIELDREDSTDGETVKCNYNLQSTLFDSKTNTQLFPINIKGRQSHVDYNKAKERAIRDLSKKIKNEFKVNFDAFLTSSSN